MNYTTVLLRTWVFFLACIAGAQANSQPVIFFSDLISAPATGWSESEPNQGAVVTIWGRNFGAQRGDSYVVVNDVPLTSDNDYKDAWAKTSNPVPFLETITFQLNSQMKQGDGQITVYVDGVKSNSIPFRVNTIGQIHFMHQGADGDGSFENPWDDDQLIDWIDDEASPGDVVYVRGGSYTQMTGSGQGIVSTYKKNANGTAQDPVAMVGYPGEEAHIDAATNGLGYNGIKYGFNMDNSDWTIAKLRITAPERAIDGSAARIRMVGNDAVGNLERYGGAGTLHSGRDGARVLGNAIHGARSNNKLDHAVYIDGCQPNEAAEIAYNYLYDNFIAEGPHLSENHQRDRCDPGSEIMEPNRWHHNVVDCSFRGAAQIHASKDSKFAASDDDAGGRGFYSYWMSWDPGEEEPAPSYLYNNIFYQCDGVWHRNGHAVFANNTLVENRGVCLRLVGNTDTSVGQILSMTYVNNVCSQRDGESKEYIVEQQSEEYGTRTYSNNIYYKGEGGLPAGDGNSVIQNPQITVGNFDVDFTPLSISATSPLIDTGTNAFTQHTVPDGTQINIFDVFGVKRFQGSSTDIGALEFTGEAIIISPPSKPPEDQITIEEQ